MLWNLNEDLNKPTPKSESNERAEILRTKFIQKHLIKVENLKQLIGKFPAPGEIFLLFTLKSFNAFTFIIYIIKHIGIIEELSFSTYSINERIVNSMVKWYDKAQLKEINITISDSIRHRVPKVNDQLQLYAADRNINIKYSWNHSKITLIRTASHHFVIEGSGNFSENAMNEQYIWLNDQEVFNFRKSCISNP